MESEINSRHKKSYSDLQQVVYLHVIYNYIMYPVSIIYLFMYGFKTIINILLKKLL
jgi:gamma-glutamylcysteine synthetase